MHRILVAFFLTLITLFSTAVARGQSAGEIVAHIVEALGGKERLQSINSLYQEGTAVQPNGEEIKIRIWRVFDRVYRPEIDYGVGKVVVIVTPNKGWINSPKTGGLFKALPDDQLRALQTEIDPAGCFIDYQAKGNKVDRVGTDTVEGRPCFKLRIWFPSSQTILYYVDQQSWYVLKETRKGGGIIGGGAFSAGWNSSNDALVDISFDEYKAVPGGYVLPYAITLGGLGKVSMSRVEVNGSMNADALSRPK
jgi:hypothetical protein